MQHEDAMWSYPFLTKRKAFSTYRWRTRSRWQFVLNPVVRSNDTTYPPSGAHMFNAVWTALHTSRERIHVLRKRPQDIPSFPRPRCTVVASRTTNTQPLPLDRDCPQANLVLRGWVRDSFHSAEGYLPSYHIVGVSLQNVNCIK
jgi:hypothetical protein